MSPLYHTNDYLVVVKLFFPKLQLKIGKDIIFYSQKYKKMLKRIVNIDFKNSFVIVKGLNNNSISSIEIGAIPFKNIEAIVIKKL